YRPVLGYLLDQPAGLAWVLGVTFLVGLAPLGNRTLFLTTLLAALVAGGLLTRHWAARALGMVGLVVLALVLDQNVQPLGREFMTPLDEGMVMDMPITVPRASVKQSTDDLKARQL